MKRKILVLMCSLLIMGIIYVIGSVIEENNRTYLTLENYETYLDISVEPDCSNSWADSIGDADCGFDSTIKGKLNNLEYYDIEVGILVSGTYKYMRYDGGWGEKKFGTSIRWTATELSLLHLGHEHTGFTPAYINSYEEGIDYEFKVRYIKGYVRPA